MKRKKTMDSIKIGKFIDETRKNLQLTQVNLAEQLYISDKTVSKWECGKGFPEVSYDSVMRKTSN